jgi:uncharacterized ferritin-like protein (DUF455 family)
MIRRLRAAADMCGAEIIETFMRDEIGHVAIGTRWFEWCCAREGVEPRETFLALLREVARGAIRGPFNVEARRAAGFDDPEMERLAALAAEL